MTKKVTVQPPKEMIFFEPTNNINLFNLKVFDTSPVKCLPILYKFTHKTSTGMLIYEYKGFENA